MKYKRPQTMKQQAVRRLLSLALAPVMALVMAVPAMAATYQVRIHPNGNTNIPTGTRDASLSGRFRAYQIFQGDIDGSNYFAGDDGINDPPAINSLTLIQWGGGIQKDKRADLLRGLIGITTPARELGVTEELLLRTDGRYLTAPGLEEYSVQYQDRSNWGRYWKNGQPSVDENELTPIGRQALKGYLADALKDDRLTLGGLFKAALESEGFIVSSGGVVSVPAYTDLDLADSAAVVVAVLDDFTDITGNTSLAEVFAKLVGAKDDAGDHLYLDGDVYVASQWDSDNCCWVIGRDNADDNDGDALQSGYYLLIDVYEHTDAENDKDQAQSDYILAVLGTQDIYVKSYVPTVKKVIINSDNGNSQGDDFDLSDGDPVTFRITGTLPENFGNYGSYQYIFTDTMSAGLSYLRDSMKVYAVAPKNGGVYLLAQGAGDTPNPDFQDPDHDDNGTRIVSFTDLKQVTTGRKVTGIGASEGAEENFTIESHWEIVIQYQATVNRSASISSLTSDNTNSVTLTYSNSVINRSSINQTTPSTNFIYDFGLDILKYDGTQNTRPPLSGAGFTLTRKNTTGYRDIVYYAFAVNGSASYGVTWASLEELNAYLARPIDSPDLTQSYTVGPRKLDYNGPLPHDLEGKRLIWEDDPFPGRAVTEIRKEPIYGSDIMYAVFERTGEDTKNYFLSAWIGAEELANYLGVGSVSAIDWDSLKETGGKLGKAAADGGYTGSDHSGKYICILTGGDGKLHIEGLKDETYTLSEVIVPKVSDKWDFVKMEDKTVKFAAEYYSPVLSEDIHPPGTLKNLYYTVDDNCTYIVRDGDFEGAFTSLSAKLELPNITVGYLPRTGGIGVILFYAVGGALLIGAVLLLILSHRKENYE